MKIAEYELKTSLAESYVFIELFFNYVDEKYFFILENEAVILILFFQVFLWDFLQL